VWLFRVAELFGYDFQTILHFADITIFELFACDIRVGVVRVMCRSGGIAELCTFIRLNKLLHEKYCIYLD